MFKLEERVGIIRIRPKNQGSRIAVIKFNYHGVMRGIAKQLPQSVSGPVGQWVLLSEKAVASMYIQIWLHI